MIQASKTLIKQLIAVSLYYSGAAWLLGAMILRRRVAVLMYHRVLPTEPRPDAFTADAIVVSAATFERHMRFLRRFCKPATAEQVRAMLAGETPWVPRSCLVTFDDGWYDNAEYALPALERHRVPAAVFVATSYLGTSRTFWQERLTRLLFAAWQLRAAAAPIYQELGAAEILGFDETFARAEIRRLVTRLKSRTREQLDELIAKLEKFLGDHGVPSASIGDDRFMSWPQAKAMHRGGLVAIESHAHSHAPLTSLDASGISRELQESQRHLRTELGHESRFLAYPNGNYNDQVVDLARGAGFKLAFTTDPGLVTQGDDPLRLRRMNIGEHGTQNNAGFLCRILGWF